MAHLGKLLGIIASTRAKRNTELPLFQRLLVAMVSGLVVIIIVAMMAWTLIVGGLYVSYICLVNYGLEPGAALVTVSIIALLVTILLFMGTISCLRRTHHNSHHTDDSNAPIIVRLRNIADAFIDGILEQPNYKKDR